MIFALRIVTIVVCFDQLSFPLFFLSSNFIYICLFIYLFIYSGYFYSAFSSPLLLRGAPDTARIPCRSFTPKCHTSEGLSQVPYLAVSAVVKPMTLRTKGVDSTNGPPRPTTPVSF